MEAQDIVNDFTEAGFTEPKQKRGLVIWLLVASFSFNIAQVYIYNRKADKSEDKYENILMKMLDDQKEKNKTLDTLKKSI